MNIKVPMILYEDIIKTNDIDNNIFDIYLIVMHPPCTVPEPN